MVGKNEIANHVVPTPTQEQLRIAQITQDSTDSEKLVFQKMVRQVMEATKCNQNQAEIALYDSGNNVEDAVLAIIEQDVDQDSWTESKNRKAKKSEAALHGIEEKENFVEKRERGHGHRGGRRGRSERIERPDREHNNRDRDARPDRENNHREFRPDGFERNERPERPERFERFERGERGNRSGRGGRGPSGTNRGSGRGGGGRGGSTRPPRREEREKENVGEGGGFSVTTWDNNMQNNKEEDVFNGDNEELNWSNTPLVFSRREPQHPAPQQSQPVQSYSSKQQPELAKPMSFAAAAARKKIELVQPTPGPIEPPQRSYEKECQPSPSASPQKPYQQQSSIFGNSGSSYGKDLDGPIHGTDSLNISRGSANDQSIGGLTFTNRAHQGYQTDTVQNLTNQLKSDLGISISAPSSGVTTASTVANLLSSFQSASNDTKQAQLGQQQQARFASTPQSNFNSTVEFVTGGGDVGSTLAEYQFGWGTESSPTARENDVDGFKQAANSYLSSTNAQTEISPKRLEIDHALSKLNHIDVSPAKSTAPSSTTQPTSYAPVAQHQANGQPQQQIQTQPTPQEQLNKLRAGSGLSYANTSTLSYPGTTTTKAQNHSQHILTITDPNTQRQTQIQQQQQQQPQQASTQTQSYSQSVAQQQQQQHHQQVQQSPAQPQHTQTQQQQLSQAQLYPQAQNFAAYSNPYMNSAYMNLYSPVTAGMRTDDAMANMGFLGYPFMNQMDLASITAMLPPAMASAAASTQAPPPTMQSHLQHQQHNQQQQHRSDQQQHYDNMPKTYSNQNLGAVTMANNTNLGQQRTTMDNSNNSAVPPPPGFTGPPSNIPTATLFQPNLSSLFQMPGSYAPNLSPFPLMFPGSTPQHKLPATMFPQPTLDDTMNMNDMRMGNTKIYGQGQQQDKYGVPNGGAKERGLNMGGAQPTPPPQISGNYAPAYGGVGGMQNMGQLHKKNQYHWNT